MDLKEYIQSYRKRLNISQRQFATRCGLSNGYISMLERGYNPKTKEPIVPTLTSLKKLADGMGITVHDLSITVDDIPVNLLVSAATEENKKDTEPSEILELKSIYNKLNSEGRKRLMSHARYLTTEEDCVVTPPTKSKIG